MVVILIFTTIMCKVVKIPIAAADPNAAAVRTAPRRSAAKGDEQTSTSF